MRQIRLQPLHDLANEVLQRWFRKSRVPGRSEKEHGGLDCPQDDVLRFVDCLEHGGRPAVLRGA